jgi:signal transduction histidine kinase
MLDFYRPGAIRYEQVDLLDLLNHVMSLTAAQLRSKNVAAKLELPNSLPVIFAVSSQIQQIFFNLILNALDAMPEGGELRITARSVADGVEISFEDSGPGIPEERKENIFEPFFSTKEGGTGLGLTVSYNIAIAHGGTLDLIEGHGSGACFRLFLPMGDKQ